jgi:pyruvate,water dikinase
VGGDRTAIDTHPQLARAIADYMAKFGDRCTEELKLESITLHEDPTPLLASIAAAASKADWQSDAREPMDADETFRRLFANRPVRRAVARALVGWARARVRDRENLRFERTRVFGRARRVFMAMGKEMHALGALEAPRDILYLTLPEVLGAIEGAAVTSDLAGIVALRKSEMQAHAARPDPPERVRLEGAAIAGFAAPAAVAQPTDDRERKGTGCCAGRVTARARVVLDPRGQKLSPGEVLVARHTDPGWIALFANASGIVVERGSLLSHSAIVARELGIPCVVGLGGATSWLTTGDTIEVDGSSGRVRKSNAG